MTSVKHVDLRLSLRSYKSAFTRLGDTVEGFLLEGLHCNSLELANGYSVKYKAQLEKLAEATDKLCATGPTDIDALYDALDLENKKFIKIHARLAEHIVAIEKNCPRCCRGFLCQFSHQCKCVKQPRGCSGKIRGCIFKTIHFN